jgi:uncharacterized membrane protein YuzA (DUF378 family)
MKKLDITATALLVIGGLNWGVLALTGTDLVGGLFGWLSPLSRVVYLLVALAGVYEVVQWKAIQRRSQPAFAER